MCLKLFKISLALKNFCCNSLNSDQQKENRLGWKYAVIRIIVLRKFVVEYCNFS